MIQLFQDSTEILPYYVHIRTYSVAVSILVAVLITAVVFLWRKLNALEKMSIEMIKDGSATMATVAQRLEDQQSMKEKQTEILNNQKNILEKIEEIKNK